jgi:hypothetical protein
MCQVIKYHMESFKKQVVEFKVVKEKTKQVWIAYERLQNNTLGKH